MDGCNLTAFLNHALCVNGGSLNLAADRSVHDGCNLFDHFYEISALFCDQGGIGSYSANNPHVICFLNVFYFCSVNKKTHNSSPFCYVNLIASGPHTLL